MYYYGYQGGYNYGSPCGCSGTPVYNYGGCCNNNNSGFGSNAAIILVLFILLVIVIGSRLVS